MANPVLALWTRAGGWPFGRWLFSRLVAWRAPYFRTVTPRIQVLEPGRCVVSMRKRWAVQNHIRTVHVIAICNLLEIAMGACAEASVPAHLRWIPKGMSVDYVAKATTDITATAEIDPEAWQPGDLVVQVRAEDTAGTVVVRGEIRLWISEKPR
ncbi:MAG: hotdog fold domain-containing protein [Pseudomonadota bacterium]